MELSAQFRDLQDVHDKFIPIYVIPVEKLDIDRVDLFYDWIGKDKLFDYSRLIYVFTNNQSQNVKQKFQEMK